MTESKPVNVLLVDDRADSLLILEAVLRSPDYRLVTAHSGPEALSRLEEREFAVILLDVQMPHMNGFETASLIKQRPQWRDIPIIFVTAINKDERYVHEGYQAGAVDYLFKPYDVDVLRSKVAVFADLYRKNVTIREQAEQLQRNERELYHARKLEAIGRLAGGVAHDFNNLLTGVLGIAEDLRTRFESDHPYQKDFGEIILAATRAFALSKQLLAIGRRQMASPRRLDLNRVVEESHVILSRLAGEDIELVTALASPLPPIFLDPSQLEQILMNLVLNARDAMGSGGRITISTEGVQFDGRHPRYSPEARAGDYVGLTVADKGCGMSEAMMSQIFEPFFTTKDTGKGIGLGLSTVYGIVKQNGGEIFVDSKLGHGSTFTVLFPAVPEAVQVPESVPEASAESESAGSETILIVEDEEIVRRVVCRLLAKKGYRTIGVKNGPEALTWVGQTSQPIDLLITDVVMPAMNGRQLAEGMSALRPSLKVLYISAYSEDIIAKRGILEPGLDFLEKSALHHSLAKKVREILDQRNRPLQAVSF